MTLRLVLVSLVAALGISIPGAPMIESWVASTQNWMNARFADWDTRNPENPDYVIVTDFYDAERIALRPPLTSNTVAVSARGNAPSGGSIIEPAAATNVSPSTTPLVARVDSTLVKPVSFVRKLTVFEPIEVGDSLSSGFAEELNRRSNGLHVWPARASEALASPTMNDLKKMTLSLYPGIKSFMVQWTQIAASLPLRSASPVPSRPRNEPLMVFENLYGGSSPGKAMRTEVVRAKATTPKTEPASPKTDVVQAKPVAPAITEAARSLDALPLAKVEATFGAMESSPSLYFAGDLNVPDEMAVVSAQPAPVAAPLAKPELKAAPGEPTAVAELPKPSARPERAQDELADLDIEVVGALLPQDDGFGSLALSAAKKALSTPSKPRFELILTGPEFGVGVACELNRRSDGIQIASPTFPTATNVATSTAPPARDLSRAVKLTRDAVYAWVNVFTGPALVTVSQSNDGPLGR
jgi:hypothetical protein